MQLSAWKQREMATACSWSLPGHSQLLEDQGGTRGRAPCGPTPEGLALAWWRQCRGTQNALSVQTERKFL